MFVPNVVFDSIDIRSLTLSREHSLKRGIMSSMYDNYIVENRIIYTINNSA